MLICLAPQSKAGPGSFLKRSFDSDVWKEKPDMRLSMIDDLLKNHKLMGITRHELLSLLGQPDTGHIVIIFHGNDKKVLELSFDLDGDPRRCIDSSTLNNKSIQASEIASEFVRVARAGFKSMSLDDIEGEALKPYSTLGACDYLLKKGWNGSSDHLQIEIKDEKVSGFKNTHCPPNHC